MLTRVKFCLKLSSRHVGRYVGAAVLQILLCSWGGGMPGMGCCFVLLHKRFPFWSAGYSLPRVVAISCICSLGYSDFDAPISRRVSLWQFCMPLFGNFKLPPASYVLTIKGSSNIKLFLLQDLSVNFSMNFGTAPHPTLTPKPPSNMRSVCA